MKALLEGARALYVESAMALDVRARHPDAAQRSAADNRLALMTPVLKSFISECAVQITDLGITVWGGHGYIHENGTEQWLRDARIVPLYEGTNAIQALDLVHRKLSQDDGRTVRDFLADVAELIREHREDSAIGDLCAPLGAALTQLSDATSMATELRRADAVAAAAAASDYLRLFGLVAMGAAWLRMAAAAQNATVAGADFCRGKTKTARFFMTRLLPEADRLYRCLHAGAASIMDVTPEEL
jgi:hypothetical protein